MFNDRVGGYWRIFFGIPRLLNVAPVATYVAAPDPGEIGRSPCMEPFSLEGIEFFHKRKHFPFFQQYFIVWVQPVRI
jgi:hypothetical protein